MVTRFSARSTASIGNIAITGRKGAVGSASEASGPSEILAARRRSTARTTEVDETIASDSRVIGSVEIEFEPQAAHGRSADAEAAPYEAELSISGLEDDEQSFVVVEQNGGFHWVEPTRRDGSTFIVRADPEGVDRSGLGKALKGVVTAVAGRALRKTFKKITESVVAAKEREHHEMPLQGFGLREYRTSHPIEADLAELAKGPSLLFLHGTFSSPRGAFGDVDQDLMRTLSARYGNRVWAYDHATISRSPADNARDLVELLKKRADGDEFEVDVIAHSRGGLVARELAERLEDSPVRVRQVCFVATPNAGTPLAANSRLGDLIDMLSTLLGLVPDETVTPAIEVVMSVLSHIWAGATEALPGLTAMDPAGGYLEGLNSDEQAQFLRKAGTLYRAAASDYEAPNDAGFRRKLRDHATDALFLRAQNDLVVPTRGVFDRLDAHNFPITERVVLESHHSIEHGDFWSSPVVEEAISEWFTGGRPSRSEVLSAASHPMIEVERSLRENDVSGALEAVNRFDDAALAGLERALGAAVPRGSRATATSPRRGRAVLVPGLTGSMLTADGNLIWLDPLEIVFGGLSDLAVDAKTTVLPAGVSTTYLPMLERLSRDWEAVPFPYDWRLSMEDAAGRLNERLTELRAVNRSSPIHIVAHSMGGLVVRVAHDLDRELWTRVLENGRVVMLGTPNRGAFSAAMTLAGDERSIQLLALADLANSAGEIKKIIRAFPGLCELLPSPDGAPEAAADEILALYDPESWGDAGISSALLTAARAQHARLFEEEGLLNGDAFAYVAGHGHETPTAMRGDGAGGFQVTTTLNGDGRVPHDFGPVGGVAAYYSGARHGDLAKDPEVLQAVAALLAGREPELPTAPPRLRDVNGSRATTRALAPISEVSPLPRGTEAIRRRAIDKKDSVAAKQLATHAASNLFGSATDAIDSRPSISVAVSHGSLEMTDSPLMIGHYRGVPISGAESYLDRKMGGALRDRQITRVYPEVAGEAALIRSRVDRPPAALVICLGDFGELTSTILTRGARDAALRWALANAPTEPSPDGPVRVDLSTVLIGTYGRYGLSTAVSLAAIVEGVMRANIELSERHIADRVVVGTLSVIENYEQKAEDTVLALRRIEEILPADVVESVSLDITRDLASLPGGRPGAPRSQAEDAWPRLAVGMEGDESERVRCPEPAPPESEEDEESEPSSESSDTDQTGSSSEGAHPPGPRIEKLRFTLLGGLARADEQGHEIEVCDIRDMIDTAVRQRRVGAQINNTLYELLFPNELKQTLANMENIWLVVDGSTAYYPWELLAGREPDGQARPLALKVGFLRQLKTSDQVKVRVSPRRPIGRRALIVGDPPTNFARLPGARREAQEVRDLLVRKGRYDIDSDLIFAGADAADPAHALRIKNALYAHEYRIVHIAAHGVIDPTDSTQTGVLIGENQHLTALAFRQMSVVPELVFLNCCHIGQIDEANTPQTNFATLAASVATQLMREGVKAVVAAGWAVDDRAAAEFARTFYEHMLDDQNFGYAVSKARAAAYAADQNSNTWGAYQCYGDPSFQLETGATLERPPELPVGRADLVDALVAEEVHAETAESDAERARISKRVDDDFASLLQEGGTHPSWRKADALAQLGITYQKLGEYEKAVYYLREAVAAGDSMLTVKQIEQLANCEVRLATRWARSRDLRLPPKEDRLVSPRTPERLITAAEARLKLLRSFGETGERFALHGSLYKKRAAITSDDPAKRVEYLKEARDLYRRATTTQTPPLAYHLNLAAQLTALIARLTGAAGERKQAKDDPWDIHQLADELRERVAAKPEHKVEFWDRAELGDSLLTLYLLELASAKKKGEAQLQDMTSNYLDAFSLRSSAFEQATVIDHIEDIVELLPEDAGDDLKRELATLGAATS